ncbi:MAG: hypothetical protein NZ959_08685 [Armatimonadetes bacterium]|nr:hypothetical protein [Armatimonadota bacterium]MDW8122546.1 hypothetical protein [Armatimonadota bacterium]
MLQRDLPRWVIVTVLTLVLLVVAGIYWALWSRSEAPRPTGMGPGPENYLPPPLGSIRLKPPKGSESQRPEGQESKPTDGSQRATRSAKGEG